MPEQETVSCKSYNKNEKSAKYFKIRHAWTQWGNKTALEGRKWSRARTGRSHFGGTAPLSAVQFVVRGCSRCSGCMFIKTWWCDNQIARLSSIFLQHLTSVGNCHHFQLIVLSTVWWHQVSSSILVVALHGKQDQRTWPETNGGFISILCPYLLTLILFRMHSSVCEAAYIHNQRSADCHIYNQNKSGTGSVLRNLTFQNS